MSLFRATASSTMGGTSIQAQKETLVQAQTRLLRDAQNGDITIKCGSKTWKCQSEILIQRCDFFRAACQGGFKESKTRVVTLDQDNEDAIDILLLYLYTLEDPVNGTRSFERAEYAYIIGDEYQVLGLKSIGLGFIERSIKTHLSVVSFTADKKMETTIRGWVGFVKRVLDGKLPDAENIKRHLLEQLVEVSKYMIKEPKFRELLEENMDFNFEFITALAQKAGKD